MNFIQNLLAKYRKHDWDFDNPIVVKDYSFNLTYIKISYKCKNCPKILRSHVLNEKDIPKDMKRGCGFVKQ